MSKFIGGVKDGKKAGKHKRPCVEVYFLDVYSCAIKCSVYKKGGDGNYHCVRTCFASELTERVVRNA